MRSINLRFLIIIFILFLSVAISALLSNFIYLGEHIRSFLAYINPLLLFFTLMAVKKVEIERIAKLVPIILIFLVSLGITQLSGLIAPLEPFFKFLIPRGSADSLVEFGRGVTLLSTEPARAGYELLFIYAGWRSLADNIKYPITMDFLFFLYVAVIIQSATAVLLSLLYFGVIYVTRVWIYFLAIPIVLITILYVDTRATILIRDLANLNDLKLIFDFLIDSSGFRLISIISSYDYAISNLFGGGVGLWQETSIQAMYGAGFQPTNIDFFLLAYDSQFISIRPSSFGANLALDVGLFGFLLFLLLLATYFWSIFQESRIEFALGILFLFSFFFIGEVGNPVPWLSLALVLRLRCNRFSTFNSAMTFNPRAAL
ncbi:MAG: hypothetical protein CMQ38_01365 [Gammaproteobacteria bacterium]|nr:hypothetical protein [Gammaproteobacteria bacterium]